MELTQKLYELFHHLWLSERLKRLFGALNGKIMNDHAKGRIWHGLFVVVLHRPFRAQQAHVLFAGVCLFLWLFVGVAVVVAVVAKDGL
jgi:hypothetical protein